jgi:signal transduction histidine kinase
VIAAINAGQIYRYVTKPWDPVDLTNAIDKAVERFEIGQELMVKNKALQEALEELQTLDQAKNQFMVLVNHELKTPLTSMMSFADLLGETKLDIDQARMLTRIKGAAVRLQEMINDALEFVSAETAQTRLELKSVPARNLFTDKALPEVITSVATNRKVRFAFSIENQNLICDEKIIRNVFRRLVHNAAKFADPDSEVLIEGKSINDGGLYELAISNAGKPIDEKRILQLLKPFTLNENMMNHTTGTGLGLPIVQAMLKLHSSSLRFRSEGQRVVVGFTLGLDPG